MLAFLVSTVLSQGYVVPASYPSTDQTQFIEGAFLSSSFVQDALKIVTSTVPANLLAIKPSTYQPATPNQPRYNDNSAQTCYWPVSGCTSSSSSFLKPDIVTCPNANQWGITFDDGPSQTPGNVADTTALLNALAAQNIKSTLFIVGSNAIQFPQVVKRAYNDGHQLALHTWSHHPLTSLTNEQIVAEIKYNEASIYAAAGVIPVLLRPPYGDIDDRVRAIAQALGYKIAFWTTDSQDTAGVSEQVVLSNVQKWFTSTSGLITLQHDISTFTVGAALKALALFASSGSRLQPMPIGTCLNEAFYRGSAPPPPPPPATTTSTSTSTRATTTSSTSLAPVQSVTTSSTASKPSSTSVSTTDSQSIPTKGASSGSKNEIFDSILFWTLGLGMLLIKVIL